MFTNFTALMNSISKTADVVQDAIQETVQVAQTALARSVINVVEMKPTVIYVRASTQDQNIEAQQYNCEMFCMQNNLQIVKIVTEKCSAYKAKSQPALAFLLEEHSGINLVVNSIDRLSRNVVKADDMLRLFNQKNITLISCKERITTFTALGRHEFRTVISASQYESELIGERVRNSINYRKANGIHIGKPKFGYVVVNKRLVKSFHEQCVIRFIVTVAKKTITIDELSAALKNLLTKIGRDYDYAPVCITVEIDDREVGELQGFEKVKVSFQMICETLNDYGIFNRGKKWTSVSVGRLFKDADNVNIGSLSLN